MFALIRTFAPQIDNNMTKKTKQKASKRYLIPVMVCLLAIVGLIYFYMFSSMSKEADTVYVYIDDDDNIDSVFTKIKTIATAQGNAGFQTLARHTAYHDNIRTGRYEIQPGDGALSVFRRMKNGMQTPLNLTIPSVRTIDRLAAVLGEKLMLDSTEIVQALTDEATCQKYGYDTLTIACMFVPNTYDIYWNTSLENFLERMQKECNTFWNEERQQKAKNMGLTQTEVITLASIVDEESNDDGEKPMIAGMYYNRLQQDMPLQADPTVKFALKDFGAKRIYEKMLRADSPFNTYRNTGLPPGPIRIPSVAGIDAVLNYTHHDYLYMCAKEDFSGTHNFARTYTEHLANAAKYSEALNKRGIK